MKLLYKKTEDVQPQSNASDGFSGEALAEWQPRGSCLATAVTTVRVLDRRGNVVHELAGLPGPCMALAWDREGDLLAILCYGSSELALWHAHSSHVTRVETSVSGAREQLMWLGFSPVHERLLALANDKGNLIMYNAQSAKKTPILGKHQRAITSGAWAPSSVGRLALGSDDMTISLSDADGQTLSLFHCNAEPQQVAAIELRSVETHTSTVVVSAVVGKKILMIGHETDVENPVNLQFQTRYGAIVTYAWFNDGYMILGFEQGFLVTISAHPTEMGMEIFAVQEYKQYVADITVAIGWRKMVSIGDHHVKCRELDNLNELSDVADVETAKNLCRVRASSDGSQIAVTSRSGDLLVFQTAVTQLAAAHMDTVAWLTGPQQITIAPDSDRSRSIVVEVEVEPHKLGVGERHVAVAFNHTVLIYDYTLGGQRVAAHEFMATVSDLQLNDRWMLVAMDGKFRLQSIIEDPSDGNRFLQLPSVDAPAPLVTAVLGHYLLFTALQNGSLTVFALDEWAPVAEWRHECAIKAIFAEPDGVRVCLLDERGDVFMHSAVDDLIIKLPSVGAAGQIRGALWETFTIDRDTLVLYDPQQLYVFVLSQDTVDGEEVTLVGTTKLPHGHRPLLLSKGIVQCSTAAAQPSGVLLDSHRTDTVLDGKPREQVSIVAHCNMATNPPIVQILQLLEQALRLRRWHYAWRLCEHTGAADDWQRLAAAALHHMNVELALRVYRRLGVAERAETLSKWLAVEERALIAAHIALLLGRHDRAERLYLTTSEPRHALQMRCDLRDWPRALELAERLAPKQVPYIEKEFAAQQERATAYADALAHYERAEIRRDDGGGGGGDDDDGEEERAEEDDEKHNESCREGEARCLLRTGDLQRGLELAKQLKGRAVKRDCALILEQLRQHADAANLFEEAQLYERAAVACMKAKNWAKVGTLLPRVRSAKIHAQYGAVLEQEGKFKEAAQAYTSAKDYVALVRVLLDRLGQVDDAVRVVRESRCAEAAKLVATHFGRLGDHASAVQFLVLSQCPQEAFEMADASHHMDDYAVAIKDEGTSEQLAQLASWYTEKGEPAKAGYFYTRAAHYTTAIEVLLAAGPQISDEAIRVAIDCATRARQPQITHRLLHFLLGHQDGVAKDPIHLFNVYVALGMTREASRTAVVIAQEETRRGSYRAARDTLLSMARELNSRKLKTPADVAQLLMLLHSYLLVKSLVRRGDTLSAARLLLRTADNISHFPSDTVNILTSAALLCQKAGLKKRAHELAVQLMRPDLQKKVVERHRRTVEQIVRRKDVSSDAASDESAASGRSACVHCKAQVGDYELTCPFCRQFMPFCLASGRHIVPSDFGQCPSCQFPAIFSELKKLSSAGERCPLCGGDRLGEARQTDAVEWLSRRESELRDISDAPQDALPDSAPQLSARSAGDLADPSPQVTVPPLLRRVA